MVFVGAKCHPADRQCFSTVITRIHCPCCASILPPHAPPVLGRSLSVSQAVGQAASLAYFAPLLGKASPCLCPAAIPPHLCRGEPRQKCSGQPGGQPFRLLAQTVSEQVRHRLRRSLNARQHTLPRTSYRYSGK